MLKMGTLGNSASQTIQILNEKEAEVKQELKIKTK